MQCSVGMGKPGVHFLPNVFWKIGNAVEGDMRASICDEGVAE